VTGIAAAQAVTLYCEISTLNATAPVAEYYAALSDGSTTNRVSFFRGAGTATITNAVTVGGVAAIPGTVAGVAAGNSKIALTCEPGRAAGAANGTVGSSSTPSAAPAYTRLYIGCNESGSANFANCIVRRITVTNAARSAAQLQSLTT
jgi:hypothetical protein